MSILKQIVFVALFIAVLRKYQSKCCDNGTSFFIDCLNIMTNTSVKH